jgi:signal transduction histidine kinase
VEHDSTGSQSRTDDAVEHDSTGSRPEADDAVEHESAADDGVTVTVGDLSDGFYVADDGPGVPLDDRDDVFEAGYSTTDTGTGFGLRIVQQVAEAHGWTIRLTESAVGGARFEIRGVEFEA